MSAVAAGAGGVVSTARLSHQHHVGSIYFLLHVLVVDPLAVVLHMSANVMAHQPCGRPDGDRCVESTAPSEAMAEALWLQAFEEQLQRQQVVNPLK